MSLVLRTSLFVDIFRDTYSIIVLFLSKSLVAVRYGRYNTVKLLLEGPEGHLIINALDGEGMSPLHISSENGKSCSK